MYCLKKVVVREKQKDSTWHECPADQHITNVHLICKRIGNAEKTVAALDKRLLVIYNLHSNLYRQVGARSHRLREWVKSEFGAVNTGFA